jgi:hypothetical protein
MNKIDEKTKAIFLCSGKFSYELQNMLTKYDS